MNCPDDFTNKVICGDCLEVMKKMPNECVDMVMTSPPYWGLRDYGIKQIFRGDKDCEHEWGNQLSHPKQEKRTIKQLRSSSGLSWNRGENASIFKWQEYSPKNQGNFCLKCQAWKGQLGLEPTPELYIEHLTAIFNEAKRVLKKEATLWLNIGDTYGGSGGAGGDYNKGGLREGQPRFKQGEARLQPKCLCMIPERLALSLIQNGWILRNKIIWFKPNSMPSSVKDRFSNRWEHVFLFSKSKKYYFDLDAVREPHKYDGRKDTLYKGGPKDMQIGKHERWPNPAGKNPGDVINAERKWDEVPGQITQSIARDHGGWYRKDGSPIVDFDKGKNPGDFWNINTQPFPEAHFAVFPETLCEKPIKAGCPEEVCKKCGKARERMIEKEDTGMTQKMPDYWDSKKGSHNRIHREGREKGKNGIPIMINKTIGWTSCGCNVGFNPGIVLDPFVGAGTVGVVAKKLGRQFILIDIKKEYCEMAEKRIAQIGHQMELRI